MSGPLDDHLRVRGRPGAPPALDAGLRAELVEDRLAVLRRLIAEAGAPGALLVRRRDVAWLTLGGQLHVVQAADEAAAPVLVTADAAVILAPNNEAGRIADEETAGLPLNLEVVPWFEEGAMSAALERRLPVLVPAGTLLRDGELEAVLGAERQRLATAEHERMRWLAAAAGAALDSATAAVLPGRTEADVVAALVGPLAAASVRVPVVLAGADERMRHRHPLPTEAPIRDRLMLVLVAERWGLHVAATRTIRLDAPPDTRHPADAAAGRVLAAMVTASRPGATLGEVLDTAATAYRAEGLPDEWRNHHQGGTIGYAPRERIATPGDATVVEEGMALAWNPSLPEGKAEATLLVGAAGAEPILA